MTDQLWQMTLGSSSIHRAITMLCPLDVPNSANPSPAGQTVLSLQSKGAPLDVSHKADVASPLIRGGGVSALNQKNDSSKILKKYNVHFPELWFWDDGLQIKNGNRSHLIPPPPGSQQAHCACQCTDIAIGKFNFIIFRIKVLASIVVQCIYSTQRCRLESSGTFSKYTSQSGDYSTPGKDKQRWGHSLALLLHSSWTICRKPMAIHRLLLSVFFLSRHLQRNLHCSPHPATKWRGDGVAGRETTRTQDKSAM